MQLHRGLLIFSAIYAVGLLSARLLGLIPEWFSFATLAAVPVAAILLCLGWHRRPTLANAARQVDQQTGTPDLFLTAALLENAPGEFKPLVASAAEAKAEKIAPAAVVPFRWHQRIWQSTLALGLLALGLQFLPQLDPFGKVEAAQQELQAEAKLNELKAATTQRIAQVRREATDDGEAKQVEKALEKLKATFNTMVPKAKPQNAEKLADTQKMLAQNWKAKAEQLKELRNQNPMSQQFGAGEQEKMQKWSEDLKAGSTEKMTQAMEQMKKDLDTLMKTEDPVKRAELTQKIRKQLQDLSQFAKENVKSQPLSASTQRAIEQLQLASKAGMSEKALEGVKQSLDLTKMELEQLAQSAKDLQKLEEALKALQMAKSLNNEDKLDGKDCQSCKGMGDYEKLFAKMMAAAGNGEGDDDDDDPNEKSGKGTKKGGKKKRGKGMGGEGFGKGGVAQEDDKVKTNFKAEKSPTAINAGKTLLTLKSKGTGEKTKAKLNYRQLIGDVRQGANEAVQQEQIPPGYHDNIKSYFDSLEQAKPAEGTE